MQKNFDEMKIGFFLWFYKRMCNQRTHLHAATYDRVVLVIVVVVLLIVNVNIEFGYGMANTSLSEPMWLLLLIVSVVAVNAVVVALFIVADGIIFGCSPCCYCCC